LGIKMEISWRTILFAFILIFVVIPLLWYYFSTWKVPSGEIITGWAVRGVEGIFSGIHKFLLWWWENFLMVSQPNQVCLNETNKSCRVR